MPRTSTSGQGRKKGVPNKNTQEIKALARTYGPDAVKRLAMLAGLLEGPGAESEATHVAAIKELLDRGYGKATQIIAGDEDEAPVQVSMRVNFVRPK